MNATRHRQRPAHPRRRPRTKGLTLTVHSSPSPSPLAAESRVSLSRVMLARDDTARLLARALFLHWLRSRAASVQVGSYLLLGVVLATPAGHPVAAGALAALAVGTPLFVAVRCARTARAMAPAGFTLGLGLGPGHLAARHAVATTVSQYSEWQSVTPVGDAVILRGPSRRILALPTELVGADLARLRALVEGTGETIAAA